MNQLLSKLIFFVIVTAVSVSVTFQSAWASANLPALQTVDSVDLSKYAGLWYEVIHLPSRLQEGCQDSTATFSLRNDGEIDILNSCRDKHDGSLHHTNGRGWSIDKSHNARLMFSFFWPFRSEYLIIDQGKEYEYSVICTPDRKRLWVISRTPKLNGDVFESILQHLEKQGFNRDSFVKTEQGKHFTPPSPQMTLTDHSPKNNAELKNGF